MVAPSDRPLKRPLMASVPSLARIRKLSPLAGVKGLDDVVKTNDTLEPIVTAPVTLS